ncbi:glutamate--tRNA ligase [Dechloromonas denitrificans]|uniref:glutamate--tRNA ligase n=1 Tax=Dechloromonas denitrificans TaxID=281362 RepID=UPI001CF870D7|nr:glutamate--tRNA ligase [Dechloromonas denitrificans]UCV10528.1 glutamate--tRNA ligase [Dechloromonas denitrificans]
MKPVRTRFAPSPTGYLHIGGARTALFSWAFARRHGGTFVLRIEDTDVARSTPEAVQAIIDGMNWLGLAHDEGPFYQMQRMERYKEAIQQMLANGTAYYCYTTREELDALRAEQEAKKEKPRYDGRWRPEAGKTLPTPPTDIPPVIRFKNPKDGVVAWDDQVKGRIEIANGELDDLIIARADGTPTYNFCVCVDDWDMGITHVIRGDDHVNNTPRQINILAALGAEVPQYAHLSMILGDDGAKLSKRHGAVSVMQYDEDGFLTEAVINYLARLGWSHGDDEVFSRQQFVEWFDLDHITASAAQFNTEKLLWLNQHYMKQLPAAELAAKVKPRLLARGINTDAGPSLENAVALYVDRSNTLNVLADAVEVFYTTITPNPELLAQHLSDEARPALVDFAAGIANVAWEAPAINALIKETVAKHGLKMPKLAMPLRVLLTGQAQTPSVDAVIVLIGRDKVISLLGGNL